MEADRPEPPDKAERRRIVEDLSTTLLVEAAAGTGKTTSMVERMVNLLAHGHCAIDALAAVTFTRKAASELRSRFQIELERAARAASGQMQERLAHAVAHVERLFIGTIHSFCGRLLRERPVEAGVDVGFQELDEVTDFRLRNQAWDEHVNEMFARDDSLLVELDDLGLEVSDLQDAFLNLANYPDVDEWPGPPVVLPDLGPAREALLAYGQHMRQLAPTFREDPGNDELMPMYRFLPRIIRQYDLEEPRQLLEVLEQFTQIKIVQRNWPEKSQGKAEHERWEEFRETYASPLVQRWRERRYEVVLRAITPALRFYDRLRRDAGGLNYQDLLIKAAALLKDKPRVRAYFGKRFTHLLVDEFQDTDPIQAEVMLYLTADDPHQKAWHLCRPREGSLFVVGDPKQSIYRFRRADIVTYEQVKQIIKASGGDVVRLWANFRTITPVLTWINETFEEVFPEEATPFMPERRRMSPGRSEEAPPALAGVASLNLPADYSNQDQIVPFEAEWVARTIRQAIDAGQAQPGDFLIITRLTKHLSIYGQKLQELEVPHQVTGGAALGDVAELRLLHACLWAATRPDDPVALVGLLRSEVFGISDAALYAFKRAGGRFFFWSREMPEALPREDADVFREAFDRLQRYHGWLNRLPGVVAMEKIVADLGLAVRARSASGGNVRAGTLAKAFEVIRSKSDLFSAADVAEYLDELIEKGEQVDSIPARPHEGTAVRVMNLHKVKGLEAPVVFLAAPVGASDRPPKIHIERSGDRVRGYMAVYGSSRGYGRPLACPPEWERYAELEQQFLDAEEQRLLYVAATRAGARLVISQREKDNFRNPWRFFFEHLTKQPTMAPAGPPEPRALPARTLRPEELVAVSAGIGARWQVVRSPSYARQTVKEISVPRGKRALTAGEHGTEWGTVMHLLLQAAMLSPKADLREHARQYLEENGLEAMLADEALATVEAVSRSSIWKRALASPRRLVEVPIQVIRQPRTFLLDEQPLLLRGVIDLAFREPAGWVIVDYKTDSGAEGSLRSLVEHYRLQVQSYADTWRDVVKEPVHEAGLYFTRPDRYVRV